MCGDRDVGGRGRGVYYRGNGRPSWGVIGENKSTFIESGDFSILKFPEKLGLVGLAMVLQGIYTVIW